MDQEQTIAALSEGMNQDREKATSTKVVLGKARTMDAVGQHLWDGNGPGEAQGDMSSGKQSTVCHCGDARAAGSLWCGPHGLAYGHGITKDTSPRDGGVRLIEGVPFVFPGDARW